MKKKDLLYSEAGYLYQYLKSNEEQFKELVKDLQSALHERFQSASEAEDVGFQFADYAVRRYEAVLEFWGFQSGSNVSFKKPPQNVDVVYYEDPEYFGFS